jgi:hypothetical protein
VLSGAAEMEGYEHSPKESHPQNGKH